MVKIGAVLAVVSAMAGATSASTSARADGFFDRDPVVGYPYRSAYLNWMASEELSGRAAPIAIANRPCFVYEDSRLVVLPCPGAYIAETPYPWVRARY